MRGLALVDVTETVRLLRACRRSAGAAIVRVDSRATGPGQEAALSGGG